MIHSRWTRALGSAIAAISTMLVAACGSSTSPKSQSAAQVAAYYDALAGTHLAAGTRGDTTEAEFISILNGPIAYGQLPTRVSVSASGAAQTWFANAAMFIDSTSADTTIIVSWWPDTVVSSFMLAEAFSGTLPNLDAALFFVASGTGSSADSSTVTVVPGTKSGSCATNIAITHVYTGAPTYDPVNLTCTPATATIGGHLHFQAQSGIATQFQDIDVSSTTISAVRLQAIHGSIYARVRNLPHGVIRLTK